MLRITHTRGRRAPHAEQFLVARLRIGSAHGNELVLAEQGVAPTHAELRFEGGAWVLLDLGPGALVNGARVMGRTPVRAGDLVRIGNAELRLDAAMPPPPGTPDAEGRIDIDTAQRIVADAVARATANDDRTASIVQAKVTAARQRTARQNAWLSAGVAIALGATVIAAAFVWRSQRAANALADEAGLGATASKPTGALPTQVFSGRDIYEQNKASLYVIGFLLGNKIGGCCTAFAIGPDRLATNAHCVIALREKGGTPIVTQNESSGKVRLKVVGMQMHPEYRGKEDAIDSPDVGLLRVDQRMARWVTLANDAELRSIGPGDDVFVLGFPGTVMDPVSPSATFLSGHVGRVTGLHEEATTSDKSVLIQHDAVTRGGNSGSPVFNQYGHVIAVHAAHIDEEDDEVHNGQRKTVVSSSPFRIGMRIDLLQRVPAP
jgi:S1-C subfamily serine protease